MVQIVFIYYTSIFIEYVKYSNVKALMLKALFARNKSVSLCFFQINLYGILYSATVFNRMIFVAVIGYVYNFTRNNIHIKDLT